MSTAKGFVVPAGGGKHFDSPRPSRSFTMKLLGRDTGESTIMFEETVRAGTTSLHHLHHNSDEIAWVLALRYSRSDSASPGAGALSRNCAATPPARNCAAAIAVGHKHASRCSPHHDWVVPHLCCCKAVQAHAT
jgi:hypothetical protein